MTGGTIDVDISGFGLRFTGLTPALAAEFLARWPAYVSGGGPSPSLSIQVEDDDRLMTPGRFMEGGLHIVASPDTVQFRRDEGRVVHDVAEARAVARLAQGDEGRRFWGLVNLACAAVGWRLMANGGGAIHAACVLIGGRAFILVGPSGCGKTTWARTAAESGLPVVSDDVVLVTASTGGLVVLGSPFRSKDFPSPGRGRWPVAALLLPHHAAEPALAPVSRLMLEARIAANLLFSSTAWGTHDATAQAASAIAGGAPAHTLAFRPDASWISLLAAIGGASERSQ